MVHLSASGYVLTNNHVVAEGSGTGTVDGDAQPTADAYGARWSAPTRPTDLAVVKVERQRSDAGHASATPTSCRSATPSLAIGSPLGLQGTVTAGIVSADRTERSQHRGQRRATSHAVIDAIQTDAAINPATPAARWSTPPAGHRHQLRDRVTARLQAATATSASASRSRPTGQAVADQLIKGGKVSHPYLGVSVGDAQQGGAQVQQVIPAARPTRPACMRATW